MMDGNFVTEATVAIVSFSIPLHVMHTEPGGVVIMSVRVRCLWSCEALHTLMFSIRLFIQSWSGIIGQTNECHRDGATGAAVSLQLSPC